MLLYILFTVNSVKVYWSVPETNKLYYICIFFWQKQAKTSVALFFTILAAPQLNRMGKNSFPKIWPLRHFVHENIIDHMYQRIVCSCSTCNACTDKEIFSDSRKVWHVHSYDSNKFYTLLLRNVKVLYSTLCCSRFLSINNSFRRSGWRFF